MYQLKKNILNNDIWNIIENFIYDLNIYKSIWQTKLNQCLLSINKELKYVSLFIDNKICIECYMQAFIHNVSYIDIDKCDLCKNNILYIKNRIIIDYNTFCSNKNLKKQFIRWYIICNSNKSLAKNIFYDNEYYYIDILNVKGLNYEIKNGPIIWTLNQKKNKILIKKYS
jgi:hypothetical protein